MVTWVIERLAYIASIQKAFHITPAVGLIGMRQVGKTTLARQYLAGLPHPTPAANYFDLEDPADVARLETPKLALESLRGTVVIDEVHSRNFVRQAFQLDSQRVL